MECPPDQKDHVEQADLPCEKDKHQEGAGQLILFKIISKKYGSIQESQQDGRSAFQEAYDRIEAEHREQRERNMEDATRLPLDQPQAEERGSHQGSLVDEEPNAARGGGIRDECEGKVQRHKEEGNRQKVWVLTGLCRATISHFLRQACDRAAIRRGMLEEECAGTFPSGKESAAARDAPA